MLPDVGDGMIRPIMSLSTGDYHIVVAFFWHAEAGELDPTMASADDFFAKLKRLEQDGLQNLRSASCAYCENKATRI